MPLGEQTAARVRTDEELIGAFQNGDQRAYDLLVGRYKDQLVNFAFRFLGEYDGADEVAQETLIRVYRKKHSYKPIAKFSTWIYTIAANLAKSELRRRTRHGLFSLSGRRRGGGEREFEPADHRNPTDGQAERSLQSGLIQDALDSLPPKYREVVVLRYVQEMSYEEICEISHTSMGTVKSRLNRARLRLQELLKGALDDE
ncbi:MAG TPA: sigma-70 family RNA polymerase sigma factor [Bacteroidota bacterium]|jgi:RNA polymerase sigma-70 factor (ECF subfamily)